MVIINRSPRNIGDKIVQFPREKLDLVAMPFGDDQLINQLQQIVNRMPAGNMTRVRFAEEMFGDLKSCLTKWTSYN
jgi:hypothetical protein